jgi:hypothetical protein
MFGRLFGTLDNRLLWYCYVISSIVQYVMCLADPITYMINNVHIFH